MRSDGISKSPPIQGVRRCHWASNELAIRYHDEEWGAPLHDDQRLFEFLILEGAQAGLSWDTILKKRKNYRSAFDRFDPLAVSRYGREKVRELLGNSGIVRNRLKIDSAIKNARAFLQVQKEFGSFDAYIWQFVGGQPRQNARRVPHQIPAHTPQSDAMSKDLKRRGFNFVGTTICYAFMQAVGMVNDHLVNCFRHEELYRLVRSPSGGSIASILQCHSSDRISAGRRPPDQSGYVAAGGYSATCKRLRAVRPGKKKPALNLRSAGIGGGFKQRLGFLDPKIVRNGEG